MTDYDIICFDTSNPYIARMPYLKGVLSRIVKGNYEQLLKIRFKIIEDEPV